MNYLNFRPYLKSAMEVEEPEDNGVYFKVVKNSALIVRNVLKDNGLF